MIDYRTQGLLDSDRLTVAECKRISAVITDASIAIGIPAALDAAESVFNLPRWKAVAIWLFF